MGRLQRNFGLTIDSLRAVELVTADGRMVRVSEAEEPDLFWGIRGAGPNFGVVTAFEFDLHPFSGTLHRGMQIYPASEVHEAWALFRDFAAIAPDAVGLIFVIGRAEPASEYPESVAGQPIAIISYNHSGDPSAVERDLAPLRTGPEPVASTSAPHVYLEIQAANDEAMGFGHRSYIKGGYADQVRPETIDRLVEHAAAAPGEGSFAVTALGGAIGRVADDAMAFTGRDARFEVSADIGWEDHHRRRGLRGMDPAGHGDRRAGRGHRPLRQRDRRARTRGDPGDLWRREAPAVDRAQARVGSG